MTTPHDATRLAFEDLVTEATALEKASDAMLLPGEPDSIRCDRDLLAALQTATYRTRRSLGDARAALASARAERGEGGDKALLAAYESGYRDCERKRERFTVENGWDKHAMRRLLRAPGPGVPRRAEDGGGVG
jgi:hypothetical protein